IAALFALHPQLVSRTTKKGCPTCRKRTINGFLVHPSHHPHFTRQTILDDGRNQTLFIEFERFHFVGGGIPPSSFQALFAPIWHKLRVSSVNALGCVSNS